MVPANELTEISKYVNEDKEATVLGIVPVRSSSLKSRCFSIDVEAMAVGIGPDMEFFAKLRYSKAVLAKREVDMVP